MVKDILDPNMDGLDRWHDGNLFFQYEYATIDIAHQIKSMDSFEEFEKFYTTELMDGNVLLSEYLTELLDRYRVKADLVALKVGYSHDYVRKIAVGDRKDPGRDILLAICTYIQATVPETQLLLRYAGQQPLYARRKRDAIIWFALKKAQEKKQELERNPEQITAHEKERMRDRHFEELNSFLHARGYKTLWKG